MAFAQKDPVTQIQMLAAVPTNVAAADAFAIRKTTGSITYVRESFLPFISFLMPSLILDSPAILPADQSFTMAVLLAIPGLVLALLALWSLRYSFAVLPSVRAVVFGGPYSVVRHPLYLGETLMLVGLVTMRCNLLMLVLLCISLALTLARIQIEEMKLRESPDYREYRARVRYRLVPGLY
ncbi:MAG TPA: isoprenylcysteine carboxylmethyltransferase family protein [Methanomassiliicoccales archaeon]|nr:isoprenylcysteine carboxylmethyltransferase family protein [Methanomassiliicoccales archaeon]